jgi:serine/threonine protein kinase
LTATDTRNICPACNALYAADVMVCARCGTGLLEVPDMKLLTGSTLDDRYDIEGIVGTGGMGAVYRARQRGMEREVAIKVLHPHFAADPRAVKRFFREAQSAARLVHPNIVTVYDFGRAREGHLYMVMELL